jgi:hypothetical protein
MSEHWLQCRRVLAAAFAMSALALGACGGSSDQGAKSSAGGTVDDQQVEQGIEDSLSSSSTDVSSAKCPSDVAVKQGGTFTCTVTFDNGASGKAEVTQKGLGNYTYALEPGSVQVPGATAEAEIQKQLASQGMPNATVNCPDNIIVKVGTTVTCDVSGVQGGATGSLTFTFSSADGTIDNSSVEVA